MPDPILGIERQGDTGWRITCPRRHVVREVVTGVGGLVAGVFLGLVSLSGLASVFTDEKTGMQLFVAGWLGPLAVTAVLLVWVGVNHLLCAGQSVRLESDGQSVTVTRFAPWGSRELLVVPATQCAIVESDATLTVRWANREGKTKVLDTRYRVTPAELASIVSVCTEKSRASTPRTASAI